MTSSGLYIAREDFITWPATLQREVLHQMWGASKVVSEPETVAVVDGGEEPVSDDDDNIAEISPGQARDFLKGCSEKTKTAIKAMVKGDSRLFQLKDVALSVGVGATELTGVWSGLTRRTKTVTKNPDAYLIDWTSGEAEFDKNGQYVDHQAGLSQMTYKSFRKALGIV